MAAAVRVALQLGESLVVPIFHFGNIGLMEVEMPGVSHRNAVVCCWFVGESGDTFSNFFVRAGIARGLRHPDVLHLASLGDREVQFHLFEVVMRNIAFGDALHHRLGVFGLGRSRYQC